MDGALDDLSLLTAVASRLDGPLDDDGAVENVLAALESERGLASLALLLLDRGHAQLVLDLAPSIPHKRRNELRLNLEMGIAPSVVSEARTQVREILDPADPLAELLHVGSNGSSPEQYLAVPVTYGGEVVGILAGARPRTMGPPLQEQMAILEIASRMLGPSAAARQARLGGGEDGDVSTRILGRSKAIRSVLESVRTVARSDTTVLILGESGTGKELVADAIHRSSARAQGPFVRVNCAALPEGVIESELFGHEAGAFTGATHRRVGRFESAHGGTIFLDEVGDLPPATQVALLRTLQERILQRVGSNEEIAVDVRVIAATHRNLSEAMSEGRFREDLYYRLDVFPIRTPSLRDRRTDIPLLADHFVEKYARTANKRIRRISSRAIDMLMAYHWPGNVRELENCMERSVLLAEDQVIQGRHLPPTLQMGERPCNAEEGKLESTLDAIERDMLDEALKLARGNMAEAARQLGLTERKMGLRVKRHQLDPKRHRCR